MTKSTPARDLADRLARPPRLGVFGHRGVGKTTLLAMLYREAVAGRLPGLRLAAGDARTASYLADKVLQLEAGQALPATLAETELRFHLYHHGRRVELVVLDYQGEHVALGKEGGVRDFLRDCDAVWLCLDAPIAGAAESRLPAEQEVEQLVEDYLATERAGEPHRPMTLLVTKADLLGDGAAARDQLPMTGHALDTHCPWHATFAVSATGGVTPPAPAGLDAPLVWLAEAVYEQDRARLEHLWRIAPNDLRSLARATRAFARRYPDEPATRAFQARLSKAVWRRRGRRAVAFAAALLALTLGLWAYDAHGAASLRRALASTDGPAGQRQAWHEYQNWYPTRHLFRRGELAHQDEAVAQLDRQLREQQMQARLAQLRRQADDPDADPRAVWADHVRFRDEFPEYDLDSEGRSLRDRLKAASDRRRQAAREAAAQHALRQLDKAAAGGRLPDLAGLAAEIVRDHPGTKAGDEAARRLAAYRRRLDEIDFADAADYSKRYPLNFLTRQQYYQRYLTRQPHGDHAAKARAEIARIAEEWDRHDYRPVRDLYARNPADLKGLLAACRAYEAAHPRGKYLNAVTQLRRWCGNVREDGEYDVELVSGSFEKKAAATISRGAYLSVTIEVNGIRHGPSTIVSRSYEPQWQYAFPRKVRWKLGDTVRIIVIDNYYWKRTVSDETFDEPLAMRRLCGEVPVRYGSVTFKSNFKMPALPKAD